MAAEVNRLAPNSSDVAAVAPARRRIVHPSLIGLVAALILLALVAGFSSIAWQQYSISATRTRATIEQLTALARLMRDVEEAENTQRGYLLTGQNPYLSRSQTVDAEIPGKLSSLRAFSPGSEAMITLLRAAVLENLHKGKETSETLNRSRNDQAALIARMEQSHTRMTHVRDLADQLNGELNNRLAELRVSTRGYAHLSQAIATLGSVGIFAIVLLSNIQIRRLLRVGSRLNEELRHSNEDLQQFIFSASHDLQEPLRTLRIYADSIESKMKAKRPVERDLFHLRNAATHMSALIQDLLVYSELDHKSMAAESEVVDLAQVAADVLDSLEALITESHAQVVMQPMPIVNISRAHATQLLQNLATNAIRYREPTRTCEIQISAVHSGRFWTIGVHDNGISIKPEYTTLIFGIFKRLHTRSEHPGTGLGLAICKKIVDRYGGRIWVESVEGSGSSFYFTLPEVPERKR